MIAGVVLFAAADEEIVLHPGDPMTAFTRLLVTLTVGLALLTQSAIVKRAGGPILIERIVAAVAVALLMVPSLDVRANLMLTAVVVAVMAALAIEHRNDRFLRPTTRPLRRRLRIEIDADSFVDPVVIETTALVVGVVLTRPVRANPVDVR